jgi:hypothetical protein
VFQTLNKKFAIYNQCRSIIKIYYTINIYVFQQAPEGKVVITGGGFISEDQADSNDKSLNLDNLKATHEEADTRMILHMLQEINPPPVITTLPSGACRMCSVAKKNAKSSLFSGKERKLGKLEGRGTLWFSITLLIGCNRF